MTNDGILFLSYIHCTGEHGKSARWLRWHGVHSSALCLGSRNYLDFECDGYDVSLQTVRAVVANYETVILEEGLPASYGLSPSDLDGKVVIRDAHGTFTRRNAERLREWDDKYPVIVRTPDLLSIVPHGWYLPCSVDFSNVRFRKVGEMDNSQRIILAHAPTSRRAKGTAILLSAMKGISEKECTFILSEQQTNSASLARRSIADVYFDSIADGSYFGYKGVLGVAGIEAAAQSQVVLGNFSSHKGVEDLPFHYDMVTNADVLIELKDLIYHPEYRNYLRRSWYSWALTYRNRDVVMRRLLDWVRTLSPYSSV